MSEAPKKNETDLLREATVSKEQLTHDFRGVQAESSLPIMNSDGARISSAQVRAPNRRELQIYADGTVKTCGSCKHFDVETGRKKMIEQRFPERLVREQDWKLRHLGAKLDELGLCGMSGGTMVTSFMAKSCDQYKEKA